MLRSIPKTRPNGLKQFGIVNPPKADKRSALYESLSKSGQNRSKKAFFELVKTKRSIFLEFNIIAHQKGAEENPFFQPG
jgi:hypothetical protein